MTTTITTTIITSCFARLRQADPPPAELSRVAISRTIPPAFPGTHAADLAPDRDWVELKAGDLAAAVERYRAQLAGLDLAEVAARLQGSCILSWEFAGFQSPRRLLAEAIESHAGIEIPEHGYSRATLLTFDQLPPARGFDPMAMPWEIDCDHCGAINVIPLYLNPVPCWKCRQRFEAFWD